MTQGPDSLGTLMHRVEALTEALAGLEQRVAALEHQPVLRPRPRPVEAEEEEPLRVLPEGALGSPGTLLGLLGRTCLILGGAFLIRALTDAGTLPKPVGVGFGVVYALLWAWMADRAGRAGKESAAVAFSLTCAAIAYPLILETTLKLDVMSPLAAAAVLVAVTLALVAVTWRQSLHATAWTVVLAALGAGLVLMAGTASVRLFALVFMGLGGGSLWLTYGRRWHGLRWPVALAANGSVLLMDLLAAWPGGPPEAYRTLTPFTAVAVSLALVLVYLGSTVVRTLQLHRAVTPFEIVQTIAVLLIGFGGAVRVAQVSGSGSALLGAAALPVGAACYLAAFLFMERQTDAGHNFLFYTTLALVFVLGGCLIALPPRGLVATTLALGVLAAFLGNQFRRSTLLSHCGLLMTTAALGSGLVGRSLEAFTIRGTLGALAFDSLQWTALAVMAGTHALLVFHRKAELAWTQRLGSLAVGTWATLGLAALAVIQLSRLLPGQAPDPGSMAVLRTGVLSCLAIFLAFQVRWLPSSELRWLVYPLLGLTALKFLVEDLAQGRPLTLFLAFTFYGAALTLAPLLMKARGGTGDPESTKP